MAEIHAWGLVVSADGTVFVADGRQEMGRIWRIESALFAPEGSRVAGGDAAGTRTAAEPTVIVEAPGVRDLQIAGDGALYYSVYRRVPAGSEADRASTGRPASPDRAPGVSAEEHGIERMSPSGVRESLVAWTSADSLFTGPCFRVDADGGVYFFWEGRLRYRSPDGATSTFLGSHERGERDGVAGVARFNSVRAMAWSPGGDLFLVDVGNVRRVSIDERVVETVASRLIERGVAKTPIEQGDPKLTNRIYGLTVGPDDRVWVAYHGGSRVLSLRRSGRSGTYYQPPDAGWAPIGVSRVDDSLYVLEVHGAVARDLRVTRIDGAGEIRVALPRNP